MKKIIDGMVIDVSEYDDDHNDQPEEQADAGLEPVAEGSE